MKISKKYKKELSPNTLGIAKEMLELHTQGHEIFGWQDMPEVLEGDWNNAIDELLEFELIESVNSEEFEFTSTLNITR